MQNQCYLNVRSKYILNALRIRKGGSVQTIQFFDPIIFLALSQLIKILIRLTNFFESE